VHGHAQPCLQIEVRLYRVGRVHVGGPHEPAGLVSADRKERKLDRADARAHLLEVTPVARVSGEEDAWPVTFDDEAAPQRPVAIEWRSRREVLGRPHRDAKGPEID